MRRLHFGVLLVLLIAIPTSPARADGAAPRPDPLLFVMPKTSPSFEEVIKGAEWEKQFAKASAHLGDLDQLSKSTYASAGTRIEHVDEGSQAAAASMVAGEIISQIDEHVLNQKDFNDFREAREQQLTIVGADGVSRQLIIHPGSVGFNALPVVRPELVYLRQGTRNSKWDSYAAVGAANCIANPALAETAWHRAMRAGYAADAISDYCGAQICWRRGHGEQAVAFCAMLNSRKDVPEAFDLQRFSLQVAVANFKIEQAIGSQMAASPGEVKSAAQGSNDRLHAMLDAHRRLPDEQRCAPPPSVVSSYVKTNLLNHMDTWPNPDDQMTQFRTGLRDVLAKRSQWYPLNCPAGLYTVAPLLPKEEAENVELVVRAKIQLAEPTHASATTLFGVALIDADEPPPPDQNGDSRNRHRAFIMAQFEPWGTCGVSDIYKDEMVAVGQRISIAEASANHRQFTVRIIHCSGQNEVWINDRRIAYLPALVQPKKVGFRLFAAGVNVDLRVDFTRLDPTQVVSN